MIRIRRCPLLWGVFLPEIAAVVAGTNVSQAQEVVWHFTNGSSDQSVGIRPGTTDNPTEGPEGIVAGNNSRVYLLDQVNQRVLVLSAENPGRQAAVLKIPRGIEATDIAFGDNTVFVWANRAVPLAGTNESGAIQQLSADAVSENAVTNAITRFAQMGSERPTSIQDVETITPLAAENGELSRSEQLQSNSGKNLRVNYEFSDNRRKATLRVVTTGDHSVSLSLSARDRFGAVELLDTDKAGHFFVLAENLPQTGDRRASMNVARFSPTGQLDRVYTVPFASGDTTPRRPITVAPSGEVFFLRVKNNGAEIVRLPAHAAIGDSLIGASDSNTPAPIATPPIQALAAHTQIDRNNIVRVALSFANASFTANPSAYGRDPDHVCRGFVPTRVRRPPYLEGHQNEDVTGVPYDWGGKRSISDFLADLQRGRVAGNLCTKENPTPGTSTGVDCSGLVSEAWGLSTHVNTNAMPHITEQLPRSSALLPGDALLLPGEHVILFLRWRPDGRMETVEAATGRCHGRVCQLVEFASEFESRGYKPVRLGDLGRGDD